MGLARIVLVVGVLVLCWVMWLFGLVDGVVWFLVCLLGCYWDFGCVGIGVVCD